MALDMNKELAALRRMTVGELHERYTEVAGEAPRSRHRAYLIRRGTVDVLALKAGTVALWKQKGPAEPGEEGQEAEAETEAESDGEADLVWRVPGA